MRVRTGPIRWNTGLKCYQFMLIDVDGSAFITTIIYGRFEL